MPSPSGREAVIGGSGHLSCGSVRTSLKTSSVLMEVGTSASHPVKNTTIQFAALEMCMIRRGAVG